MILADSDVLIDFLQGQGAADRVREEISRSNLCTSVISRFELLVGARNERQETVVRELLSIVPALDIDEDVADRAASLRRALDDQGLSLGMADCLIAGVALERSLPLLTRNRRHHSRIKDLLLVEPS